MSREEVTYVKDYINRISQRINNAKNAIRDLNIGMADKILSEPFPKLELRQDD